MKHITLWLILLWGLSASALVLTQDLSTATNDKQQNPLFTSSLDFVKNPVPIEEAEATSESEMKSSTRQ